VSLVDETTDMEGDHHSLRGKDVPPGVLVFSVFGALMFGAAEKLENILLHQHQEPRVLILRMQKVLAMDSTALHTLEHLHRKLSQRGIGLILSGPHTQPYVLMENSGFLNQLGHENVTGNIDEALAIARGLC
jgi:SulP family sulfate permease